jgi:hypothetical protein
MNHEPFTSIENPTLAHFRHFSHFRHSVPRSFPTDCTILKGVRIITYFQTHSFLTNKPNFQKSQTNVSIYLQTAYENKHDWTIGQNKPNSNPIKPNFQNAQMNINFFAKGYYESKPTFAANNPNLVFTTTWSCAAKIVTPEG